MKTAGKSVSERSSSMFLSLFIAECGPLAAEGVVMAVLDHSFDVLVQSLGVTKRVYVNVSF